MFIGIALSLTARLMMGGFSPASLFLAGEPGVWYDPSDVANLTWRRNLLTYSEQFDNAAWVKSNSTITANTLVAPDGTTTADLMYPTTTGLWRGVYAVGVAANTQYTLTVYAKAAGLNFLALGFDNATSAMAWFNLSTGVRGTKGASISDYTITSAGSGWYRCAVTFTHTAAAYSYISMSDSDNSGTSTTSGTSGIFIWGAQLELGSVATDYQRITDVNTEVIERFPNATLYQDVAGTIPVTGPTNLAGNASTVALMLDKSKGLVLGAELVTNGGFASGTTGWAGSGASIAVVSGELEVTGSLGTGRASQSSIPTTAGVRYKLTLNGRTVTSNANIYIYNTADNANLLSLATVGSTSAVYTGSFVATGTSVYIWLACSTGVVGYFDNVSIKALTGNHATQGTIASRPTYGVVPQGGRRNLLTWSEDFRNTADAGSTRPWVYTNVTVGPNSAVAPDGTMTADTLTATANSAYTSNPWSATGAASYINSVYVRRRTGVGQIFIYNPAVSAASPIAVTSEWTRFSGPTSATSGSFVIQLQTSGDQIDIWGAQGEAGSTATPYQKVTTQYDVTEAGVPSCSYLFFDGGSDSMSTSTITPGTDKAQVFAGVRKLVDSPSGAVIEFGNLAADNGGFAVHAPNTAVGLQYRWSLRNNAGTVTDLGPVAGYAAPITNVLTGIGDISGDLSTIRINSAQVATSAADQGTGNFNSYALTVGARVGGSLYFNGNLFGLITRFGANLTTQQITSTEQWLAPKSTFFAPVITGVPTVGVS